MYISRQEFDMQKLYKTELHCHTGITSGCGHCSPEYILSRYLQAGYSTVVITDHFNRLNVSMAPKLHDYLKNNSLSTNWQSKIDFFLSGYKKMKQISEGKLNILLGMEFQSWVDGQGNDYLIYGVSEDWLKASDYIQRFSYKEMSIYAQEFGLKIYQAHPFRIRSTISDPRFLNGIEVYNATINVNSNNRIADMWADHYGLNKISGSDFHETIHQTAGGILTAEPIITNEQLINVLSSQNNYELIRDIEEIR